jgi:tetratricopeptide (TPR) repeat protein
LSLAIGIEHYGSRRRAAHGNRPVVANRNWLPPPQTSRMNSSMFQGSLPTKAARPQGMRRALALLLVAGLAGMPAVQAQEGPGTRAAPEATPAPDAKRARSAFQQGEQAQAGGDWPAAFQHYQEAALYAPQNRDYLLRREAARFRVIQAHVDRGERAAIAGRLDEARREFEAAAALDPSYAVAQERLEQLRQPRRTLESLGQKEAGLPSLQLQPGARSFDYRGDTRGAFEQVAKQFGVTATFDPDLRQKQIRFRVDDLDFETTMRVLCQQTDTFWFPLDLHSFFVADDTAQKRRELEPSVVRTVTISSLASPEQLTELTRLARDITGITRTQLDTRTRTLTLRGSPASVALAARLIGELDQALGEMMLEVDILEVDRNSMLRLGITPPSSARAFTISPADIDEAQQSPEALLRVLQRIFGTGSASQFASGGALIPPLVAFGGGRTIGLATLPGATADFLQAYSILRRARRLLLRAQDGQRATFFIGERFPIALATLQPNLISPLAVNVGGGSFPRTDLEAGDGPVAIATADFDQDGQPDLAVANATANSVSIFLGVGDGTFETRTDIALPATEMKPSAIVVADFNTDGRPDIVVTNEDSNSIAILLQDPSGGTFTITTRSVGTEPRAVVAANFNPNSDSNQDLAIANFGDNTITVLLGNGDGTFQPNILVQNFGQGPLALAVGNFSGDNVPDLVAVNETSETVAVLVGQGDGTFSFFAEGATGDAPSAVLLADFNADNLLDLVIANRESDTVSVLLGNGDGTFDSATEFFTGDAPAGLATGDFNIDGVPDLAVVNEDADSVSILLGAGGGTFGLRADFATGDAPTSVVAVDFDTDGRRDLATTNREGDTVSIILNQISLLPPGSISGLQAPYPGFQYEDLGVKIRAMPRLHPNQEVTLQLEMEIRSRTGQSVNGIPVISNRTLEQSVRLRENERTVLTGIIQREERLGITGWPGLASVPVAGRGISRRNRDRPESELLIVITPRRIRLADRAGTMLYVGRETGTAGGAAPPQ